MHWRRLARAEGREKNPPWDERRRANKARRETKKRSAGRGFDPVVVYERDGWLCGLCGGPVDRSLAWPDPMSASLDHVIPLADGGGHTPKNAQCSHLVCNERKGGRKVA